MHLISCVTILTVALLGFTCQPPVDEAQISREQAIEISREQVSFDPDSVEAVRSTTDGRTVWRVTFLGRLPGQPPELSEMVVVELDATTGEVVSVART